VLFKLIDVVIGVRVSDEEEIEGLDLTQHGERGYNL
jgi:Amt family ammonium transporter